MRILVLITAMSVITSCLGCSTQQNLPDETGIANNILEDTDIGDTADSELPTWNNGTIIGSVQFNYEQAGQTICDTLTSFSGSPYTGNCNGCEFAFVIDSEIVEDNSVESCHGSPFLQLHLNEENAVYMDYLVLMQQPVIYNVYGSLYDVLSVAVPVDYPPSLFTAFTLAFDGSEYGSWSQTENNIQWTFDYAGTNQSLHLYDMCSAPSVITPSTNAFVGTEFIGSIQCTRYFFDEDTFESETFPGTVDTWSFHASAGDTIQISVDTFHLPTAGDLAVWVNTPEGCTTLYSDDSFECAVGNSNCPAFSFIAPSTGNYQVIIDTNACDIDDSDHVDYSLVIDIDGLEAVEASLEEDDGPRLDSVDFRYFSTGEATISSLE